MIVLHLCALLWFSLVQVSYSSISVKHLNFVVDQFKRHRTVQYYEEIRGVSNVIIRRGDYFTFALELNNPYDGQKVGTILSFETQKDAMTINLPFANGVNGWSIQQSGSGQRINAFIRIPANAPVGVWKMKIVLMDKNGNTLEQLLVPNKIVILFNPWAKSDATYFPDQQKLSEYLMNERGYTYSYNWQKLSSRPWIFGQFQNGVLDAVLFALSNSRLTAVQRGDVVLVARELTNLMNYVLRGRWGEPYDTFDGRPAMKPWEWTGSPAIYKEYMENGGKPAAFGQCWVFAGILTTAYRTLGIPARPVSNFASAHSNQRDLTIDTYLDKNGEISRREPLWNFHVWTQAWFQRRDLGSQQFGGWQELDGTPQEISDGRYQLGPVSNFALRTSQLNTSYQSDFLYEEYNADDVVWSAKREIVSINPKRVGLALVTKEYGGEGVSDITAMYKPKEGTPEERQSYELAAKSLGIRPPSLYFPNGRAAKRMVNIDIQTPNSTVVGSTVFLKVKLQNPSSKHFKKLVTKIRVTAMYYNGKVAHVLKKLKKTIELAGFSSQTVDFSVKPEEYFGKLPHYATINIESSVINGQSISFNEKRFSLNTPALKVKGPKLVNVNQTFTLDVEIRNPYNRRLSNCYITVEGIRIKRKVIPVKDIAANAVQKATVPLRSSYAHKESLSIHFYSNYLTEMLGSMDFAVKGPLSYQFASYWIKQRSNELFNNLNLIEDSLLGHNERTHIPTIDSFECCRLYPIN